MRSLLIALIALTGCAVTRSHYVPVATIQSAPKETTQVQLLAQQPKRAAIQQGLITVRGNCYASFEDLSQDARKEAAALGADCILLEESGHDQRTVYTAGYTSFQSQGSCCGQITSGYSTGPIQETILLPWATYSVWRYQPSQLGLRLENNTVVGFHLRSDAPVAGVQIGDQLLGIDHYDVEDDQLPTHLLSILPGDTVTLTLQRASTRLTCPITAINN